MSGAGSNAAGGTRSESAARPGAGRRDRAGVREDEPDEDHDPGDGRDDPDALDTSDDADDGAPPTGEKKRKGSFWRELPLLILVAIVLTFVIQTFVARIYVIPSASMEQTLHGCTGCTNDRVAVDKVTYRFSDPAPGDVVVFRGPPAWRESDEVATDQPSSNPLVRGVTDALSLVGLASPNEKDFVKRVIAVGGQTVACCDPQNHVTVDGRPLDETYLYFQAGTPPAQEAFDPVVVPEGQLWVMGDNRNNSADARFHGPIGVTDVIGQARIVVLPVPRWGIVSSVDPQVQASALGAPAWTTPALGGSALLLAVPVVGLRRRLRGRLLVEREQGRGPEPGRGRRAGRRR
jgi:signal peptidase I